jgi:HSP20 family protein
MYTNPGLNIWRDALSPISEFRREFDRIFDDWTPARRGVGVDATFSPACDVEEAEDHFLLSLEMAGMKREDIKVEVRDSQLFVSGERKAESSARPNAELYRERRFGRFSRGIALPAGIDPDQIEASYQDGVLRLLVPKAESAKPRQIQIANGSGTSKFFSKLLSRSKEAEEMHSSGERPSQSFAS